MRHTLLPIVFALCVILNILPTHAQQWVQLGQDIDGEAAGVGFGHSVSLSSDGSRIAIGSPNGNDGSGIRVGHVRTYDWNGSSWVQVGQEIYGEAQNDMSGVSVSLSSDGSRIAIGANGNDGSEIQAGHVRIYDWNGSSWVQVGQDIDGEAAGDQSGYSVSLSSDGSLLGIGNNIGSISRGRVRVYQLVGSSWLQLGADIIGDTIGDFFGLRISLSSDGLRLAVSGLAYPGVGIATGQVKIYNWSGLSWVQMGQDIYGAEGDQAGSSVSLSHNGSRVAIGAPGNDGNGINAGCARIYDWNGSSWIQVGQDINGELAEDQFGFPLQLSSDGNRVAIAGLQNDGNGPESGHVRIYDWNGSSWVQSGQDIDGEAQEDQFGWSVCLSSDGSRLASGAPPNDENGIQAGHVRVYQLNNSATSTETLLESTFPTTISAYPNPFQRDLTVDLGGNYSSISMRVYDILGKEVYSEDFYDTSILNAALDLPLGTYSIIISDDTGSEAELKVTVSK